MESILPVMVSFGTPCALRNFQLCEVEGSRKLGDLLSLFGLEGWSTINWNEVVVKVSSSKSGGFDKFSLNNSVDLVLRILKTDVLWVIIEKCVREPPPLLVNNAFDLLKQAQTAKVLPSKIKKPFNQKQKLFNSLVDWFHGKGVGFSATECAPKEKHKPTGQGTQLLLDITDVLWKIGQSSKQLSGRGFWNQIPAELLELIKFEIKSKEPVLMTQQSSKLFAEQIRDLTDRTVMAQDKLGTLRLALLKAAEVFQKYSSWLKTNLEAKVKKSMDLKSVGTGVEGVIKQLSDREKIHFIEKGNKPMTNPHVIKVFDALKDSEPYTAVNISVLLPTNKNARYYILHTAIPHQAPGRLIIWAFHNGSNAPQSLFAFPVGEEETTQEILEKVSQIRPKLLNLQKIFFPREFYQQFYAQVGTVSGVSAQEFKLMSSMICGDSRKFDGNVQERFAEALMSGDPDYVFDLRHFNGREIKFKEFLQEFRAAVEEYMVEDRGRHEQLYNGTVVSKVSMGFSLRSVFENVCKKVLEKLPNCPLPKSEYFLHRYLIPRTRAAAQSLSNQAPLIPLRLTSQQKVIEKPNIDAYYNAAQYKYLKNMAVDLGEKLVTLIGWDDKTGVDVGEKHQPTAATQHTGKSWAHQDAVPGEGQHSFHKTNLTPSVRFIHEIPEDMDGSFYRGQPQLSIKDAIFQPSSSARHATELAQMFLSQSELVKPVLILTNDGGSDHTIRFERNIIAVLALFLHFPDIQLLINFQLAAYRSAYHPVEKLNCLLNLSWNGISLAREDIEDPVLEKVFSRCNSMKDARKAGEKHPGLSEAVLKSLKPAVKLLEERAEQANLKGNAFQVFDPATEGEVREFFTIVTSIDENFDVDEFMDKSKTYHYSPGVKAYLEDHMISTYYSISLKRDKDLGHEALMQKNPDINWPQAGLQTLSCPLLDKENPEKFVSYSDLLKGSERDFSDKCRPGKLQKTPSNIPFPKNKLRATYGAKVEIVCDQCSKRRVVYFKYKPTKHQIDEVCHELKFVRYICGGRISSFGRSLAVVEELSEAGNVIFDITEDVGHNLGDVQCNVDEELVSEDSEIDLEEGGRQDDLIDENLNNVNMIDLLTGSGPAQKTSQSIRNWTAEMCNFCFKMETGHKCKSCLLPCCNLCNMVDVENLGDILCPNCNSPVDLLDEFVPEEHFVTEGRVGSSVSASTSQTLIPLKYKKKEQLKKPRLEESVKRPRDNQAKASKGSFIEDSSSDESSHDDTNSSEMLSEHRLMGKKSMLRSVFIDESLTCDVPLEAHLFDVLMVLGRPLPCYYCGEKDPLKISSTLSDEEFPLCRKCTESGRGAATRRKSRKLKPKPMKIKKPVGVASSSKRKRSSLV